MPNPNEVACSFIPAFFERLASGPSELASMYAPQSSLVVVDSDCGTTEASGADVVPTILNLATIFNGREWCVERFSAASLYSGVCIHTSLAVESATARHYFHFVTVLEEIPARDYEPPSYYIRHQTIIRQGAVEKEQPSEKKVDDVEARLADHQRSEDGPASTNGTEKSRARAEGLAAGGVAAAVGTSVTNGNSKPKSWATMASAALKGEPRSSIKVTSGESVPGRGAAKSYSAPSTKTAQNSEQQRASTQQRNPRTPHNSAKPAGDRLMFNIRHQVSDDEVLAALGPLANRVVSIRNNSASGHVFLDFAGEDSVLDVLKAEPLVIGSSKTRVNIYKQRPREQNLRESA